MLPRVHGVFEELEQNCSNPEQLSERERGVTARYANGLSTLFAIRGHLWKPGMAHAAASYLQCSFLDSCKNLKKINETYMCESIPNFVDTHSR